jgi:hypothetical protein
MYSKILIMLVDRIGRHCQIGRREISPQVVAIERARKPHPGFDSPFLSLQLQVRQLGSPADHSEDSVPPRFHVHQVFDGIQEQVHAILCLHDAHVGDKVCQPFLEFGTGREPELSQIGARLYDEASIPRDLAADRGDLAEGLIRGDGHVGGPKREALGQADHPVQKRDARKTNPAQFRHQVVVVENEADAEQFEK